MDPGFGVAGEMFARPAKLLFPCVLESCSGAGQISSGEVGVCGGGEAFRLYREESVNISHKLDERTFNAQGMELNPGG